MFPHSVWRMLVTMVILGVGLSEACSCMQTHKQQHFCSAKFAMRLIIRGSEVVYINASQQSSDEVNYLYPISRIYHVYKTKVFKRSPEWDTVVNKTVIYSPYEESACGRTFKEKEKYFVTGFIAGGKLWTNLCSWVEEWSEMPVRQRRLVRSAYNKYCDMCKVETCYQCNKLESNPGSCYWDVNSDFASCYDQFAVCKCKEDASGEPQCRWTYGKRVDGRVNEFHVCYKTIQKKRAPGKNKPIPKSDDIVKDN